MDPLTFSLCWSPVLLLAVLAVVFKRPALEMSVWGALFTFGLVVLWFETPVRVTLLAALDGALTTLPLVLVILAGILLSSLLLATGSFKRIVDWAMAGVRDAFQRSLLITLGVGNFMEGASVIAEPVVAPMLAAAGVSPFGAASLSIIGYAGLMTLEMAGLIITVLALVTGLPAYDLGLASAWLSIPATLSMAACLPFFLPGPPGVWRRLALSLGCGLLVGLVALAAAAWLGVSISGMLGGLGLIVALLALGPGGLRLNGQIARDLAPFGFMLLALLLLNVVPPLKDLTVNRLGLKLSLTPVHDVTLTPFFSAYTYLFLAFLLSVRLLRVPAEQVRRALSQGGSKGWRACLAMSLFGAMGQMIAFSGWSAGFASLDQAHNLPHLLAQGLFVQTGSLYPVFVPFLGWVGTFLTGYGVAAIMLFGQLQVQAAELMNVSATWLSAGLAVGASLGSISSPFKIAIATPMCNAQGQEGAILRWTIPLGVAASLLIGLLLWLFL